MQTSTFRLILNLLLVLSLILPSAATATTDTGMGAAESPAVFADSGLYRTRIPVDSPSRWARLAQLNIVILERNEGSALVLVNGEQLETLARLRFQPQASDELNTLLQAQGEGRQWLRTSMGPVLEKGMAVQALRVAADELNAQAEDAAAAELRAALHALSPEQIAGVASSISPDDDGDGLTNTEEGWWCTDPLNPNSDGDAQGFTDGQEVAALLDFTLPRITRWNYGPPFGPPAAWPNFNNRDGTGVNVCNDGDYDTIPDYAEAYVVGTRVGTGDSENTDGDKFDDGQEFFGTTFCLPGQPDCGYGLYPRNQDFNFITNGMPSWIRPPGDSPFVAAYPVIDFLVDPATIEVTTKEIHTIERTITQGEEISSGFAETQGNSTTVGTVDTNTHSTWQENSTTEGGIEPASAAALSIPQATTAFQPLVTGQAALMDGDIESAIPEHLCLITGLSSVSVSTGTPESLAVICRNLAADLFPAPAEPFAYAITKIELTPTAQKETEQALIDWMPVWRSTLLPTGSPALPILGRRLGAQWRWSFAGDTNYRSWLESIPTRPDEETPQPSLGDHPLALSQDRMRGFKLPWSPETGNVAVTQGEYCLGDPSCFSHQTSYAYDFARSNGKGFAVVAAQGGKVIAKKESSDSGCGESKCADDMNYITIQHDDGTTAHYWHLAKDSVPFEVGERVQQGEQIGWAGSTGWSTAIHLHIEVRQNGSTVPIGFDEVAEQEHNDGMPIKGHSYTSANILPRNTCLVPEVASGNPINATLPGQGKPASFIEVIGRKLKSWWGQLTGATALAQATGLAASPPGCSGSSCTSQVSGSGNYNLNYSDSRSAGQCGGSFSADSGSDWGVGGGGSGLALNDTGGAIERLRVWSQTTTNGEGWSTSHSELRSETQYAEITRSRTNTLVSSEAWSTATAVDPTDAAALTFNYNLYNTGSDAAVHLTGIKINILIGDLPVITQNLPDSFDILPGGAKGPFGSGQIKLTLDQLAAIDNGAPIRVVLADYGYDDNLYDANAWGRSVLFHVDDGPADGDETIDTYLITTNLAQGETYQDTLARYFDVTTFQGAPGDERNGAITGIRTPEFAGDGEITGWHDHPVDDHAWWELSVSLGGETAGVQHFRDMPAKAKTDVYLRYVLDTDADGFSDRAELDAGADPADPASHPRPLVTVAQHTAVNGSSASVQVTLQNDGNLDASSVELWAIAADDSITVNDNLVGGGGRVRAGRQVVLGARIGKPDLANWTTGTAKPYPDGQFEGTSPKTFKFQALDAGNVGAGTLRVRWSSDNGATWQATPLALGSGYTAWTPLPLSDGLSIAFSGGYIALNETFTFATALPIDTFAYTINRTPYTPPLIIASYNDPQGNHKFVSNVALADIQADLAPYLGRMRYGFQMDVMGETALHAGTNTAYIVFNNPADTAISGGNVFVEFATPDGVVAKEYVLANQTFQPGPNVATLAWDTADFSPAFDPAQDYHILAFAADRQGTIFENTVKDLDQLGQDQLPAFVMADADATWDFGTTSQGTLLTRSFTFANTGALDLLTYVSAPAGLTVSQTGSRRVGLADMTTYEMALNTASLAVGAYDGTITIRTSDPANPTRTVHVTGTVTAAAADTPVGAMQRPLDWPATVSGTQGQWVEFPHTLGPTPQTLHPVKVYSQDYASLKGVGKYATPFGAGTASYDMFGDGRDGVMPSSGNLDNNNGAGVGVVNSGGAGSYQVNVTDVYGVWRINPGDAVLIHQTQGSGAGCWEINRAVSDFGGGTATYQLQNPLKCNYASGGNNHAQIQRVPQYTDCPVSGTVTPLTSWNGTWGGILALMCRETMSVTGSVNASGMGFRGGAVGSNNRIDGQQGENTNGTRYNSTNANAIGGGGGQKGLSGTASSAGGGGGGYATNGINGSVNDKLQTIGGTGGGTYGDGSLATVVFGGAGGSSGGIDNGSDPGDGGNGGGMVVIFANDLSVIGTIRANGDNGTNGTADAGGGGGGAGGSVLIRSKTANTGTYRILAEGGNGGLRAGDAGNGGRGGDGRIRIEYCGSVSGTTNPPASAQKLNCYIVEQIESTPYNRARLNLPATGANTYQVQYGRKLNWGDGANQVTTLRVPAGMFTSVTLQALVSDLPSNASFALDIGNTGSNSWSGTVGNGGEYTSPNLAAFFNAYWASHGAPTAGTLDVPVRVYLDRAGQVLLTNLQVTPTGSKARAIRLPVRPQGYSNVAASFTVSGGAGPLAVGVDVGGDGTIDWTYTGAPAYPAALTTGNLATAANAYLASVGGQPSADVPLRFHLSPFATLALTGFAATPTGGTDASIGAGDVTFGGATAIAALAGDPVEGDTITINAAIHNPGSLDTGPLTASFYAMPAGGTAWYIGSAFVPNVAAAGTETVPLQWNTMGFTGDVPVRVVVDPFDRVAETNEANNQATANLTILTRPDLHIPSPGLETDPGIALDDAEPVVGQAVQVSVLVQNNGQTGAGASTLALSVEDPNGAASQICAPTPAVPGQSSVTETCAWTPSLPGRHRLYAAADDGGAVNESNESNNRQWRDVYVGFAGPLQLDSGGASDSKYSASNGYGYIDEGAADTVSHCGSAPHQTYRHDPGGAVLYRFDHLLPAHFYHLDLVLFDCAPGTGRQQYVKINGYTVAGPINLSDGQVHRLSLLVDPAFYTTHSIVVTVSESESRMGAIVNEISLHDIDYRYADAGSGNDPAYSAERGHGWLDTPAISSWGSRPFETARVDQADNEIRYRFDNLDPGKRYLLRFTFYQGSGVNRMQQIRVNGQSLGADFTLVSGQTYIESRDVPLSAYSTNPDIIASVVRLDTSVGPLISEIALEERTQASAAACQVTATPYRATARGNVTILGQPAPAGSVITAENPRGEVVGCMVTTSAGIYIMTIYGEDTTATPPIPGMRAGEQVIFRVDGSLAVAGPTMVWQNGQVVWVNLDAGAIQGQSILLNPNWNLFSINLQPPATTLSTVLGSISGKYCRVLAENSIYDCTVPERFHTLKDILPGRGYWLRLEGGASANLQVQGTQVDPATPINLHQGWNWIGYLPAFSQPIADALAGIAGDYLWVADGAGSFYDPLFPDFSNLHLMEPGKGYLLYATTDTTLIYPNPVAATGAAGVVAASAVCQEAQPTPYFMVLFGGLTFDGQPAPVGVRVHALTARGEVAGCFQVNTAGQYGFVPIFGADTVEPPVPGFFAGEPITLLVDGLPVSLPEPLLWRDSKAPQRLDLHLPSPQRLYLPTIRQ